MQQPPPLPPMNPYAAPMARIDDFDGGQLVLADRGMRLVAALVDTIIVIAVMAVIGIIAAIMVPALGSNASGQSDEVAAAILGFFVMAALAALLIVNLVLLHRYGQTIGKRLFNMKIVRVDGSRCSLPRIIFARWLPTAVLSMIPLIGFLFTLIDPLLIFRADHRCMHDLIADTIVVKV